MHTVIITESQFDALMEQQLINESVQSILQKVKIGAMSVAAALATISTIETLGEKQKQQIEQEIIAAAPKGEEEKEQDKPVDNTQKEWQEIANDATVTVYNADPRQCNADVRHTASGFAIDLNHPERHRIIAMERTFMRDMGLKWGDIIKIEGTYKGKQDGVYRVEDLMNKRFGDPKSKDYCPHKIDVLVANNVSYGGTWPGEHAKIYKLTDASRSDIYRAKMAPEYKNI